MWYLQAIAKSHYGNRAGAILNGLPESRQRQIVRSPDVGFLCTKTEWKNEE